MADLGKSFIINRDESWSFYGKYSGFEIENNILKTSSPNSCYVSYSLDSTENYMTWQRMKINTEISKDARISVVVYVSDLNIPPSSCHGLFRILSQEKNVPDTIDKLLESLEPEHGFEILSSISNINVDNIQDILLYNLQGKYLWFGIKLSSYTSLESRINQVMVEFPKISFVDYLPQMYRKSDFTARFIAIFQSIYLDLEKEIANTPLKFNPYATDDEFLNWLVSWFGINDPYMWKSSSLRNFLESCIRIYKKKGTKSSIIEIVDMYLGIEPILIERFEVIENDFYKANKSVIDNLFGSNDYVFTMLIPSNSIGNSSELLELIKIVNKFKPMEMILNPVSLDKSIYLDYHCYLGINSVLGDAKEIVLDEQFRIDGGNYEQ